MKQNCALSGTALMYTLVYNLHFSCFFYLLEKCFNQITNKHDEQINVQSKKMTHRSPGQHTEWNSEKSKTRKSRYRVKKKKNLANRKCQRHVKTPRCPGQHKKSLEVVGRRAMVHLFPNANLSSWG